MEIVVDQMIRKFRKEKGMTVRQLGAEIGVSDSLISLYETGKRNPPIDACVKLANLFDVSLEVLIRGKEKDRPEERSFESVSKRFENYSAAELRELGSLITYLQYRKEREQSEGQGSADSL